MLDTQQVLDLARERAGIQSDYRLAQLLGVSKQSITHYRQGRTAPDERVSARLAELAQLDPDLVAVWMQLERARSDEARATWRSVADRLAKTAALGLVALGVSITPDAGAEILATGVSQTPSDTRTGQGLYIMSNALRSRNQPDRPASSASRSAATTSSSST
jgi:transcriptional regulator with XRE-family HTH domain